MKNPTKTLISWKYVRDDISISEDLKKQVAKDTKEVQDILSWKDSRKLLIIWPCSMDFREPILEYAKRLKKISDKVDDKIKVVMRAYSAKPRTTVWWKGVQFSGEFWSDSCVSNWLIYSRELMIDILKIWLPIADELLYPSRLWYFKDLISYFAIWARSSENQSHREISSLLDIPVWLKNPTSWDLVVAVNSLIAARSDQHITFWWDEWDTDWNKSSHIILRWKNFMWKSEPNYSKENVDLVEELMNKKWLKSKIIIDLNHENSWKQCLEQPRILNESLENWEIIAWFMCESYLVDWNQSAKEDNVEAIEKWKSITDPCLWWEKTEEMVNDLYWKL